MSLILEAVEIKRLWPAYNRSLKRFEYAFALYSFEDQNGYMRLIIDRKKKFSKPHYTFNEILEGYNLIKSLITGFNLCPKLCFVQRNSDPCTSFGEESCKGACEQLEPVELYNERVIIALNSLSSILPGFLLIDEGRTFEEKSCLLIENGQFFGMGYISSDLIQADVSLLKAHLTPYPANDYIRNMILNAALRFPQKVRDIYVN
jgi:DNA polymerase-3 subunit epsilon